VQIVLDAVQNSDSAQAAFAALTAKARNTIIGIPGLTEIVSTAAGEERLHRRLAAMALGESLFNATLRDAGDGKTGAGETIDHRQIDWAGVPELMYAFATFVASVSDIPVTRLLGRAPEGMNASGESQQADWTKMVRARQKLVLRPCLDALDAALVPSALGEPAPADLWWDFAPLDTPSAAEEAGRFKVTMEAIEKVRATGAVPEPAFAAGVRSVLVENGWMAGIEAGEPPAPEPTAG
jgi:phage-related protein (TIGR01555 family)